MLRFHSAPPSRPSLLARFHRHLVSPSLLLPSHPTFWFLSLLYGFDLGFPPHSNPRLYPRLPVPKTVFIFRHIPVSFISFSSPPRHSSSPFFLGVLLGLWQYSAAVKPLYQRVPATIALTVTFAVELPDLPHACTRSHTRTHPFVCGADTV